MSCVTCDSWDISTCISDREFASQASFMRIERYSKNVVDLSSSSSLGM